MISNDLNLSYTTGRYTVDTWLDKVTKARHNIALEIVESFGEDMSYEGWTSYVHNNYDFDNLGVDIKVEEKDKPKNVIGGILEYAELIGTYASGSPEKWQQAVQEVAQWYTQYVPAYSQMRCSVCPLTGKQSRWDCSGFVTTCLQRYGLFTNTNWAPSSKDFKDNDETGYILSKGGFVKYLFTSWDDVQPYDIICYNNGFRGHIEIYNGLINGRHTSWSWGARHTILPCYTYNTKQGYDVIWRCEGGGSDVSSILKGISKMNTMFDFKNLHVNEGNAADVCKACYQAFKEAGCTDAAAKGICANIIEESQMNPGIMTWDGSVKSGRFGIGGGLCGFYFYGELPALAKYVWGANGQARLNELNAKVRDSGLPYPKTPVHAANTKHITKTFGGFPFSLKEQLSYVTYILGTKRYAFIKSMADPKQAAMAWEKYYERPAREHDRWAKNGNKVMALLTK